MLFSQGKRSQRTFSPPLPSDYQTQSQQQQQPENVSNIIKVSQTNEGKL